MCIENKKIIVFVLPALGVGGAESVMIDLANIWSKEHTIYFLVGDICGEFKDRVKDQVKLISMNQKRFSRCILPIRKHILNIKPDIVLSSLVYANVITGIAKKLAGPHATLVLREATTPSIHLKDKSFFFKIMVKMVYRWADIIITGSHGVMNDLIANFGISKNKVRVIKNPIISQRILDLSKEAIDHPYFRKKGSPVLLTVGKVIDVKDYTTLIKAFVILRQRVKCKLIIVGPIVDKKLYKSLQRIINKNHLKGDVDFVGFQQNPYAYMARACCFVLSSKYEGSPGVLVQALKINGNVVSTNCPSGPAEILGNGKYGRLVEVGNTIQLAQGIEEAICYSYDWKDASTLAGFNLEKSAQKYLESINQAS